VVNNFARGHYPVTSDANLRPPAVASLGGHLMDLKIADVMLQKFKDKNPRLADGVDKGSRALRELLTQARKTKANITMSDVTQAIGKDIVELVLNRLWKLADNCNGWQGFMILHACGGGASSGLGCVMLERLSKDYGKQSKLSFTTWTCPQVAAAVVAPYTTVLCVHSRLEHTDVTIMMDNEALYDICRCNLDIGRPMYTNSLLASCNGPAAVEVGGPSCGPSRPVQAARTEEHIHAECAH